MKVLMMLLERASRQQCPGERASKQVSGPLARLGKSLLLQSALKLLNCGKSVNTSGIEGKLLLVVAVYCLPALAPNLPHFQLPIDICTPPLHVSGR